MLSRIAMVEQLLGLPVLDKDHKQLVTLLALLKDALDLGDRGLARSIGRTLYGKAQAHFSNESALFDSSRFPKRQEHERGHDFVLHRLERLCGDLDIEHPARQLLQAVEEIEEIFARNLLPQDEEFARYMRDAEAAEPAL